MNGKIFLEVLRDFECSHPEVLKITREATNITEEAAYFSLDLSLSKRAILDAFFNKDNNKFRFAEKYVKRIGDTYETPHWIQEIANMY